MNLSFWNVDNLQRQDRVHYTTPHTYFPLMLSCCVCQLRETHSSLLETRLGAAPGLLSRPPPQVPVSYQCPFCSKSPSRCPLASAALSPESPLSGTVSRLSLCVFRDLDCLKAGGC